MLVRGSPDPQLSARVVATRPLAGVRAGSGLVQLVERLLVVQDDAFAIAWVDLATFDVRVVPLRGDGAALPKLEKPDFEAAAADTDGSVWLFGSGSTPRRCALGRVDVDGGAVTIHERPELYDAVSVAAELEGRPNVEAAVIDRDALHLFHRGAGARPSAMISLALSALEGAAPVVIDRRTFDLGALDGVPLSFTDATMVGQTTFFLAAAEVTDNAIDDGRVVGSVLGWLGRESAAWTPLVDQDGRPIACKAEGLAVDEDLRGAWAITDPDDAAAPALLLRIALDGFTVR